MIVLGGIVLSAFGVVGISLAAYSKTVLIQHDSSDLLIGTNYSQITTDFEVNFDAKVGNSVYIYNNLGTVNGITYPTYLPMYWTTGNNWKYTLTLPYNTTFNFKYVKAITDNPTTGQEWELGGSGAPFRTHTTSSSSRISIGWNTCKASFSVNYRTNMGESIGIHAWIPNTDTKHWDLIDFVSGETWAGTLSYSYVASGYKYKYYMHKDGQDNTYEGGDGRTLSFATSTIVDHTGEAWGSY